MHDGKEGVWTRENLDGAFGEGSLLLPKQQLFQVGVQGSQPPLPFPVRKVDVLICPCVSIPPPRLLSKVPSQTTAPLTARKPDPRGLQDATCTPRKENLQGRNSATCFVTSL